MSATRSLHRLWLSVLKEFSSHQSDDACEESGRGTAIACASAVSYPQLLTRTREMVCDVSSRSQPSLMVSPLLNLMIMKVSDASYWLQSSFLALISQSQMKENASDFAFCQLPSS